MANLPTQPRSLSSPRVFQANTPVTTPDFRNRVRELAAVRDSFASLAAGAPRWLALIGARKIGKTSLLLEAAGEIPAGVCVAMVDVMEHAPPTPDFFRTLALVAVDALLAEAIGGSLHRRAHDPKRFQELLIENNVVAGLPSPVRIALHRLVDEDPDAEAARRWLQLPEELAAALGKKLVLVIDEVQELARLRGKALEPFPLMRAVWQRHSEVAYVLSGSAPGMIRELVTDRHSPFFQHFQLVELGPFAHSDALDLLTSASPPDRRISKRLARRIVEIAGGHPFYLQIVGEALVATEPPYDEASLKPVLQSLLFARTGRLSLFFENEYTRLIGRSTTMAATLRAVAAHGPLRLAAIARTIGASTASTARYLERLADTVVRDDAGNYAVADPMFALWIRWRSPGGTVVPMKVIGDEAEFAVAEHLSGMGFDLVYQSRGSRGAFDLLAIRGPVQLGLQVKRSSLPVRFSKREWNRMEADAERFGWDWAIATVDATGEVFLLDPAKARRGREVRLDADTSIENLLRFVDRRR